MGLGIAIIMFIVQQSNLVIYSEKCDLTKAVMHNLDGELVKPEMTQW